MAIKMKIHLGLPESSNCFPQMMLLPSDLSHTGDVGKDTQMPVAVFRACFPGSYQLVPSLLFPITWTKTLGKIQTTTFWQQKEKKAKAFKHYWWTSETNQAWMSLFFPPPNCLWHACMNSNYLLNKAHTLPTCGINSAGTAQLSAQEPVCTWNKLEEL